MTLFAKSLKGDSRATSTLLNMMLRALPFADTTDTTGQLLDANEEELMAVIEARLERKAALPTKTDALLDKSGNQS